MTHHLANDAARQHGRRVIVRTWCQCGQAVITAGPTHQAAWRKARRVHRHHQGFAAAAGPGGGEC